MFLFDTDQVTDPLTHYEHPLRSENFHANSIARCTLKQLVSIFLAHNHFLLNHKSNDLPSKQKNEWRARKRAVESISWTLESSPQCRQREASAYRIMIISFLSNVIPKGSNDGTEKQKEDGKEVRECHWNKDHQRGETARKMTKGTPSRSHRFSMRTKQCETLLIFSTPVICPHPLPRVRKPSTAPSLPQHVESFAMHYF